MNTSSTRLELLGRIVKAALKGLLPHRQTGHPVLCLLYAGAVISLVYTLWLMPSTFHIAITVCLWLILLAGNIGSAIAETQGKMQVERVHKTKEIFARRLVNGKEEVIPAKHLEIGDIVICKAGDLIPADGEVIEGIATINEAAITGESAPVIRESGGDRNAVTEATQVISNQIVIRVTAKKGDSLISSIFSLIQSAKTDTTTNQTILHIVLTTVSFLFITMVISLKLLAEHQQQFFLTESYFFTPPVLIAFMAMLLPTAVSCLSSTISIAGTNRLFQSHVIAKTSQSIERAADIDLLILDKTGTITFGNRVAINFIPLFGTPLEYLVEAAQLASLYDETPEGKSIVALAKNKYNVRIDHLNFKKINLIHFSQHYHMSGIDIKNDEDQIVRTIRKGSEEVIREYIQKQGNGVDKEHLQAYLKPITSRGETPLLLAEGDQILGIIHLKDMIKGSIKERFSEMRRMGIHTLMVTGDNPLTAGSIAAEIGVDDFVANATPAMKLARLRQEQENGHLVAMMGDGINDAPALAQANVGVAMNTGSQSAREAGDMIDLDNNPTKLLIIVRVGKQMLVTRGVLTTFSLANDLAKYFAIIPALFSSWIALTGSPGPLSIFNVMHLASPQSAIISTLIYTILAIVCLIPLALKGVPYRPETAERLLQHHMLWYGVVGGLVAPFIGIKLIDLVVSLFI